MKKITYIMVACTILATSCRFGDSSTTSVQPLSREQQADSICLKMQRLLDKLQHGIPVKVDINRGNLGIGQTIVPYQVIDCHYKFDHQSTVDLVAMDCPDQVSCIGFFNPQTAPASGYACPMRSKRDVDSFILLVYQLRLL